MQVNESVGGSGCNRLLYAQHIEEYGRHSFKGICERDLEGIVAKRKMRSTSRVEMAGSRSRIKRTRRPTGDKSCSRGGSSLLISRLPWSALYYHPDRSTQQAEPSS